MSEGRLSSCRWKLWSDFIFSPSTSRISIQIPRRSSQGSDSIFREPSRLENWIRYRRNGAFPWTLRSKKLFSPFLPSLPIPLSLNPLLPLQGQTLVANIDHRDSSSLHLSLFDPSDPSSLASHESSINVQLVREGLARIDKRSRLREAYPGVVRALDRAQEEARRGRYGAYELGDVNLLNFLSLSLCIALLIGNWRGFDAVLYRS